jgi:hypothetical protein
MSILRPTLHQPLCAGTTFGRATPRNPEWATVPATRTQNERANASNPECQCLRHFADRGQRQHCLQCVSSWSVAEPRYA